MNSIETRAQYLTTEQLRTELTTKVDTEYATLMGEWSDPRNPENKLHKKLVAFEEAVIKTYKNEEDYTLILRALRLATVGHQLNEKEFSEDHKDPKLRKEADADGYRPLYITHPLAIASALAGIPRTVSVDIDTEAVDINVRQHPAQPEIVAAALLHDFIEDVKYDGKESNELKSTLLTYLRSGNKSSRVLRLVDAVTHEKIEDLPEEVLYAIQNSHLFETMLKGLRQKKPEKDVKDIEFQLTRTISDIYKMFSVSFPNAGKGKISQEDIATFFGAFAIKTHDVENNIETHTRDDKLMRAHLFAELARVLNFPVASRLAMHLVAAQGYSLYGNESSIDAEKNMVVQYADAERDLENRPTFAIISSAGKSNERKHTLNIASIQIPLPTHEELRGVSGKALSPSLQFEIKLTKPEMWLASGRMNRTDRIIPVELNGTRYRMKPIKANVHDSMREVRRKVVYFKIEDDDGSTIGIVRCVDRQPTAHDVIKLDSFARVKYVPEHRFFLSFNGTAESMLTILNQFNPLPDSADEETAAQS